MILLLALFANTVSAATCALNFEWNLKKEGALLKSPSYTTEFMFLNEKEILVAALPPAKQPTTPLQIYTKNKDGWAFDKEASSLLPNVAHPRQIVYKDVIGDKQKELIISDHGVDISPFPGAFPVVLTKIKNRWSLDPSASKIPPAFTFNSEVVATPKGKGILRANVAIGGVEIFIPEKTGWKNASHLLPKAELSKTCFMTALSEDFDNNGKPDLFLGGCDQAVESIHQKHDRILTFEKNKWNLLPAETLSPRKRNSKWGTVFVSTINSNNDSKKDLIVATHDFGFYEWSLAIYENESSPGKIKFKEIELPLKQEVQTEGFVYAVEDLDIGKTKALLVEVRSVLRDPKKSHPKVWTRLMVQKQDRYVDATECLPDAISKTGYHIKKFPGSRNKLLLVPFAGDIYSVEVSQK